MTPRTTSAMWERNCATGRHALPGREENVSENGKLFTAHAEAAPPFALTLTCDNRRQLLELRCAIALETLGLPHLAVAYDPHLLGDLAHEELVVADEDDGALEGLDALGQGADALEVEVVGGLIQDDDVWLDVAHRREGHARALPAREAGAEHGLLERGHAHPVEVPPQLLRVVCAAVAREAVLHELERRHVQIDLLRVMLVDDRHARLLLPSDLALGRRQRAGHQLDEGRLAVAVLAEQHDAAAAVHPYLTPLEERLRRAGVAEADPHELDQEAVELPTCLEVHRQLHVV
eukprot:scaffold19826_cov60-Phaeocystis_antarctica.AAC.1